VSIPARRPVAKADATLLTNSSSAGERGPLAVPEQGEEAPGGAVDAEPGPELVTEAVPGPEEVAVAR
jgi:hypothetical protein